MNVYIVVEGVAEKKIFPSWINIIKPELSQVFTLPDITDNNFYLISGNGFPNYFEYIKNAIETINSTQVFDKLIISVDSEDLSKQDKYDEVSSFLKSHPCSAEVRIIVQHFCLETWLLGDKKVGPRNPRNDELKLYKNYYDVFTNDPELLPDYPLKNLNRAQFAFLYLKRMLKDKRLNYSKGATKSVCHPKYLKELINRNSTTSHIESFSGMLDAFNF